MKLSRLVALLLTVVMLSSCAGIALAADKPEGYPDVMTDANGNPVDLGGIEIIIADWFSSGERAPATTQQQEDTYAWQDWLMETYNFKLSSQNVIGNYNDDLEVFLNLCSVPDGKNYIYTLGAQYVVQPIRNNLLVDWSKIDCIDLTAEKWNKGDLEFMTNNGGVYGVYAGNSEPRDGIYFNKRVLEEAGIEPDSIYDMQADKTWTWDKFEELVKQCTRDVDNDGVTDVYGLGGFMEDFYMMSVFTNNASLFSVDENGKLYISAQEDACLEALNWSTRMRAEYGVPQPEGSSWDWFYPSWLAGKVAFFCYETWNGFNESAVFDTMEDEWGFVAYPMGPNGTHYLNATQDTIAVIPNIYDDETAWKIAFAFNLWSEPVPGYEDDDSWKTRLYAKTDERAVDESYAMLRDPAHTTMNKAYYLGDLATVQGQPLTWRLGWAGTPAEIIEAALPVWQSLIDIANGETK